MKTIFITYLFLISFPSFGWGPNGHRLVARIAEINLNPEKARGIYELLDGQSLPMISTWADEIRSDKSFSHTGNWHYINIESDKKVESKNFEGKAVEVLSEQIEILKNPKSESNKKATAIKWIVHIVADLHQPLHAGLASDRGGNTVDLKWFGNKTNLHELWDSGMIESRKLSYSELADFLSRQVTEKHKAMASDPVLKWIEEDIALRELVYSIPQKTKGKKAKKSKWEYDYLYRTKEVLDDQLIKAGLRLAYILENAVSTDKKLK